MPNEFGWTRIREVLPKAIAYAVDSSGMQCAFDTPPIYHHTGRWVPTNNGNKANLGLLDVGRGFDGSSTLQFSPDINDELLAFQKDMQDTHNQRFPAKDSPVPARDATDPREKGPDAFGQQQAQSMTPAELIQANMEAMGAPKQPTAEPVPKPKAKPEAEPAPVAQPRGKDAAMLDLVLLMAGMLPKAKRAKVQPLIDEITK